MRHRDVVTTGLGAWFMAGLILDVWAHNNVPELETFFTPWHAVFYSGFLVTAGWVAWVCRDALTTQRWDAVPTGYGPTLVGLAGFAVAGVADLVWHTIFGIEQGVDILFSPSHLALAASMFVIITTPLRSGGRSIAAVVSAAFAATLVLLLLQYANVLTFEAPFVVFALSGVDESGFTTSFVTSMAITNVVVVLTMLVLARRWHPPLGTATVLYAALGALSSAVTGFRNVDLVVGFLLAGVAVDLLGRALRPSPERPARFRAYGGLIGLLTWTVFVATAYVLASDLRLPPDLGGGPVPAAVELATGAPVLQGLVGVLLAVLLSPRRPSAPQVQGQDPGSGRYPAPNSDSIPDRAL